MHFRAKTLLAIGKEAIGEESRPSYSKKPLLFPLLLSILLGGLVFWGSLTQAQELDFVPGEVIAHFKAGIIDFPVGSDSKPISEVSILNPQARAVLQEIATSEIGRVFRVRSV